MNIAMKLVAGSDLVRRCLFGARARTWIAALKSGISESAADISHWHADKVEKERRSVDSLLVLEELQSNSIIQRARSEVR